MKKYIGFSMIYTFLLLFSMPNVYSKSYIYDLSEKTNNSYITNESSTSTQANAAVFSFESESQVLMEATTGKIVYSNNENEKLYPASVTKIMTLLLTMEQIDSGKLKYDDKIVCSAKASSMGGSQIWFKEGEELTVEDALKCICVVSANDVTVAMAEKIGGSEENFVNMMNNKAKMLGMENTHFMNSHGIDEEEHYTSAKDIAIMSRELITQHPDILKYTSIWMDSIRGGTFELSSTNKLIRYYEGATGLKTGSTSKALFNLSGTATRGNTTFIAVVMKAPSSDVRLAEIKQLLDYGFATYESKSIVKRGDVIDSISINKNVEEKCEIVVKSDIGYLTEKGEVVDYSKKIAYNLDIVAPIKKGDTLGTLEIIDNTSGEIIGKSDIIANCNVEKSSFKAYLAETLKKYIME